jgi:hypothetical protein
VVIWWKPIKKREKEERESAKAWLAMHVRHDQKGNAIFPNGQCMRVVW